LLKVSHVAGTIEAVGPEVDEFKPFVEIVLPLVVPHDERMR
jgi:NADPH:quinone reductase-like Zn-dependent oxidoreductase